MAISTGDVVRISAIATDYFGQDEINTWDVHVAASGSGGDTGFKDDCVEFMEQIYGPLTTFISSNSVKTALSFYHRNGSKFLTPIAWVGAAYSGSGDLIPPASAALLVLRTAVRGVRGRKFIGGFTEGNNTGGQPSSSLVTALEDTGDEYIQGAIGSNGWDLEAAIWSQRDSVAYPPSEVFVSPNWATQRRRYPYRGS